MADKQFAVVFRGVIAPGADPVQVKAKLAQLFKADAARVEAMFTGKPVVIKKGVDEATAKNYQAALAKAGAVAEVLSAGPKTPPATAEQPADVAEDAATPRRVPDQPASSPPVSGEARFRDAPLVQKALRDGPPRPLETSLAEVGTVLADPRPVEAANIPTEHLGMAEVGVDLAEHTPQKAPEFDLSGMELAPEGVDLDEQRPTPPVSIDTSAFSLDDPPPA